MRYLSLYSGIEAASVAWEPLGWTPLAFSEFDRAPSAVLAHRFPGVPNLGDVTAVDWEAWRAEHGRPDVMIAGSPCQAFSVAGKRRSLEDARGNLALFTAELVRYLDPRVFIFENVPGVLSTTDNAFGCFLGEIVGAGAPLTPAGERWSNAGVVSGPERRAAWRVLDAQYFGVAQRRRRIFVVASADDGPDPAQVLLEPEGVRRHHPPSREPREGAAGGAPSGFAASSLGSYAESAGGGTPRANGGDLGGGSETLIADVAHTLRGEGFDASEDGTGRGTPLVIASWHANAERCIDYSPPITRQNDGPPIVMAPAFSKRPGQQIATRTDDSSFALTTGEPPRVLAFNARQDPDISGEVTHPLDTDGYTQAVAFAQNQLGEIRTSQVSGTLNTNGNATGRCAPLAAVGMAVRRLTPIETERLQGFPDGWTELPGKSADGPRYKMCGNSMAVPVIRWLGARIEAVDTGAPYTYGIPEAARDEIEGRNG